MTGAIATQKTKLCINALSQTVGLAFASTDPLNPTITRSSGSFVTDNIGAGSVVTTNSTAANKGPFLIKSATSSALVIDVAADTAQGFAIALTTQTSASMTLKWVKEMTTFSGLDGEASDVDVTSMDSTAKEFLSGLGDNGSFKGDFNYVSDDPGQTGDAGRDRQPRAGGVPSAACRTTRSSSSTPM
jgi:hypothetical protein